MSHHSQRIASLIATICLATLGPRMVMKAEIQAPEADLTTQTDRLARDVERATALRDVKRLQHLYTQFGQYGMWREMADLFATNAEAVFRERVVRGRDAIHQHLVTTLGRGRDGMPVGGVYAQIMQAPVVTLSEDGNRAKARWQELSMLGQFNATAEWTGGFHESEFIRENGVWKIARLGYFHLFEGPYESGWLVTRPKNAWVPYHYTPAQAGKPVPDLPLDLPRPTPRSSTQLESDLATAERQILKLNEEDKVRNLQNIYGYYVDRKMWDDVVDLFTADSAYEAVGIGVYRGPSGVRRAMEREGGPINLRHGQVHDHLQLSTVVTVADSGVEARARGLQLGMLTPKLGEAYWSISTFDNRYVKQGGIWRIQEMRIYPVMKTDYYQGWAKNRIVDPAPGPEFAPDQPSPSSNSPQVSPVVPQFRFPNPATGRTITYPSGRTPIGGEALVRTAAPTAASASQTTDLSTRLAEARRRLAVSKAYDAIENISSTFGYYLDDFQWQNYVENYAVNGRRKKGSGGFYIGRNRIFLVEALGYGHMPPDRDGIRVHTRVQPVIDVSADATSAYIRTRMFLYFANPRTPGAWSSGMYPNDSAVLEDGIWKFNVGGAIDETYFSSNGYQNGWARPNPAGRGGATAESAGVDSAAAGEAGVQAPAGARGRGGRAGGARVGAAGQNAGVAPAPSGEDAAEGGGRAGRAGGSALASTRLGGRAPTGVRSDIQVEFPPDAHYNQMPYRGQGFVATLPNYRGWPDIKPMWFHYKNPVSGRVPEFYCPDILTCGSGVPQP